MMNLTKLYNSDFYAYLFSFITDDLLWIKELNPSVFFMWSEKSNLYVLLLCIKVPNLYVTFLWLTKLNLSNIFLWLTKPNPYNPGVQRDLPSGTRPHLLCKDTGQNWYLNHTGKLMLLFRECTYLKIIIIEIRPMHNIHPCTKLIECFFLTNWKIFTLKAHASKYMINLILIINAIKLLVSTNKNIHPPFNWKLKMPSLLRHTVPSMCNGTICFNTGFLLAPFKILLFCFVLANKKKAMNYLSAFKLNYTGKKINRHINTYSTSPDQCGNLSLSLLPFRSNNNSNKLKRYISGVTLIVARDIDLLAAHQSPDLPGRNKRTASLPRPFSGLIFEQKMSGKNLASLLNCLYGGRKLYCRIKYSQPLVLSNIMFKSSPKIVNTLQYALFPHRYLIKNNSCVNCGGVYIYQISGNDNFCSSSSMHLMNFAVPVLPVFINSLITEKLITFLSLNYLTNHNDFISTWLLTITATLLLITKLMNGQISGISRLDYFFPNTELIMDFCAFYMLLISLVSVTLVTFPSIYYLPNLIFLVTVFLMLITIFLKCQVSKKVRNYCSMNSDYLFLNTTIIIGFDIAALNLAAQLANRRPAAVYRGGAYIPHHLASDCLLTPNQQAPAGDHNQPLIDLEPTNSTLVQLPSEDNHQTRHPDLQTTNSQTPDTNSTFFNGEPMNVDTSVIFYSHTTPAKLSELRRQSLAQSAFLTNKQSLQTPPRELYDKFIEENIIMNGKRITTALNCPNTEPAERNLKANDRMNGWFCTKFKVGQGKSKVDVTVTLPPHRPVLLILGASHCSRMANIHVPTTANNDHSKDAGHYLWLRTGFVRTVASAGDLLPIFQELMSKVCSLCIETYGNFCDTGTAVILVPLSWDAVNIKINLDDYTASLLELSHILYQFVTTVSWQQRWALCAQFTELPIFHRFQLRCHKVNHIVRNINELLNPNHPPIRPWISLSAPRAKNVECTRPLYIETLKDRHLPYETMDGKHLSSNGYIKWLEVILNGAVLALVDQSLYKVVDDFDKIETVNVDVDRSIYFLTTASTQKAIESDLLDTNLIVRLRELRHPRIDCSALETAYPDPRPPTPEVIEIPAVAQPEHHRSRNRNSPYDGANRLHRGIYSKTPYKYRN